MGALILLLLVTTRRIRHQALLPPPTAVVDVIEVEAVKPTAIPVRERIDSDHEPISPWMAFNEQPVVIATPQVDWEAEREKLRHQYQLAKIERERNQRTINAEWSEKLAQVMQQAQEYETRLKHAETIVANEQTASEQAQAEVNQLTQKLALAMTEKASLLNAFEQRKEAMQKIESEYLDLQKELSDNLEHADEKEVEFEIVGFHGTSKTKRRPILVECRADGISFAVEGITLTPDQLSGFTAAHNPLKAGGEALGDYWTRTENLEATNTKPYVLLLIRPGGTVAFYVARQMFEKMDEEFGYELIPHQNPLRWAPADPQAVKVCRDAVEAVLQERAQLAARLKTGRLPIAGSLMFEGTDGYFHLQEVDQLRNAGETLGNGMDKWRPPQRSLTGKSGSYNSSGSPDSSEASREMVRQYANSQGGRSIDKSRGDQPVASHSNSHPLKEGSGLKSLEELLEEHRNFHANGHTPGMMSAAQSEAGAGSRTKLETFVPPAPDEVFGNYTESQGALQAAADAQSSNQNSMTGQPSQSGQLPSQQPSFGQQSQSEQAGQGANGAQGASCGQRNGRNTTGKAVLEQRLEDWVHRDPQASIGIEREIKIHVWKDRVQVDDLQPLDIPSSLTPEEIRTQFEIYLRTYFSTWEAAPSSFFWSPYLRYQIHPGGNLPYARLKPITDAWKAKTKTDYVLD